MKNLILAVTLIIMLNINAFSQNVGINSDGSNPDNSAMLDVKSSNKGLLIPQIALTGVNDASTISTPAVSLLVYNTATVSGLTPGYYYNAGTTVTPIWTRFATGSLSGSGTGTQLTFWNSATDLSSSANLYWDNTNSRLGIGTVSPTYSLTIGGSGNKFGVENASIFTAKNSGGTYEQYFWPRWSDNVMYMNYGIGGFNIRNNSFSSTMFLTNDLRVGIGTTIPNTSAILDVKSTNKGMLIPQIALTEVTDATTIAIPAVSLLIYNTATAGVSPNNVTPGYYYNAGTTDAPVWTRLTTAIADGSETKVTAGTNVTLTGTGTTANPYVINTAPTLTEVQRNALTPEEGLIIFNSTTKKPNYYSGTFWMNFDGTIAQLIAIGDNCRGGKVAYILQSGDPGYISGETHGLIAAVADQGTAIAWSKFKITIGTTGTDIGTGSANTTAIIIDQGNTGTYAAKICRDYAGGGYNDWYLPSRDELDKLYLNRVAIGGFSASIYLSSSEYSSSTSWQQAFNNGTQGEGSKFVNCYVRAVRSF